ncbi:MAG TPA: hypothetical protein V6D17_23195 [Candidatus Obscuribacterales bacterium]
MASTTDHQIISLPNWGTSEEIRSFCRTFNPTFLFRKPEKVDADVQVLVYSHIRY